MAKKPRRTRIIDGVICSVKGIPLTRASNTMTEQECVKWVLSNLRKMTMRWKPKLDRLNIGRKKLPIGKNGREVFANTCENCKEWFKMSFLEMDHIKPIGKFTNFLDAGRWLINALLEIDGYQRLCKKCHLQKTTTEKNDEKERS